MSESRPWWERGAVSPPRDSASRPSSIPARASTAFHPQHALHSTTPARTPSNERARSRRGTAAGSSGNPGAGPRGAR
eukprot:4195481-Prymnesium_polylepis.1